MRPVLTAANQVRAWSAVRVCSLVASAREVRDGDQDLGSLEESGGLQVCTRVGGAVRWLQVHVPAARARRLQVGPWADPVVRHLRRVHRSAHNRRLTGARDAATRFMAASG